MKTTSLKQVLATLLLAITFGFLAPAHNASAGVQDASSYVEKLGTQAVAVISNKKLSKPQKQKALEKIFADNVDIAWVGKFVMGRFWRTATDDQKKRYLKEYQSFILTHYASRFAEYSSGTFSVIGKKDDGENEYTISMSMKATDEKAEPVFVDYRVRKEGAGFKVFDVIVEGVSMITTQRSEFGALLSDKGIDYLIEQLATKSLPTKS